MTYIAQLDSKVQELILALTEQKLNNDEICGYQFAEAMDNVAHEKVSNVIDELIQYVYMATDWLNYHDIHMKNIYE